MRHVHALFDFCFDFMLLVFVRIIACDFCILADVQYNNVATVNGQLQSKLLLSVLNEANYFKDIDKNYVVLKL